MLLIEQIIEEQGRRRNWLAQRLGVSPSMVTLLLKGERRWTAEYRRAAAEALQIPEAILFADLLPEATEQSEPTEQAGPVIIGAAEVPEGTLE